MDNDRKKAIVTTIVFHVILLLLFMIFGLTQPDPLPEQQGAMIELGWVESSSGDGGTVEPITPEQTTPTAAETPVVEEEVDTQDEETVAIPDKPVEKPKETKPVTEKPKEPKPEEQKPSKELTNAASNVWNTKPGDTGKGDDDAKPGNSGNPDGNPAGHGVMGGTGNSWSLSGRGLEGSAVVTEKPREEGLVVLKIYVGRDGKVIRTEFDMRNSKSTSTHLIALAKKAAMKARFNADPSAAAEQQGSMTFLFKLE